MSQPSSSVPPEIIEAGLELQRGGRALVFVTAPGREDLASIWRLRSSGAVRVRLAYLTNGEATLRGPRIEFPNQVAAGLREAAAAAGEHLGVEPVFLNLPDVDGLSRYDLLEASWPSDSLRVMLKRELEDFQPDLVLLNGFERVESPSATWTSTLAALQKALAALKAERRWTPGVVAHSVFAPAAGRRAGRRSADTTLERAEASYAGWRWAVPVERVVYSTVAGFPVRASRGVQDVSSLHRRLLPPALAGLDSSVRAYGARVLQWRRLPTGEARRKASVEAMDLLGRIDRSLVGTNWGTTVDRRVLLDWRGALESIRTSMLGVRAYWNVSENVLTHVQLTTIQIDSIRGLSADGKTTVYFPMVQKGWIVNEGVENAHPLTLGEPYRIISPKAIDFDLPRELDGLSRRKWRTPWYLFIIHQAKNAERSVSLRLDAGFLGAPRFAVDVLTPVTMAAPGESIVIRLTNNSRDGVRDNLAVRSELVRSETMPFRLNAKGASETDTLDLLFADELGSGTHIAEVSIGQEAVGRFVVRKFPVAVDSLKSVALVGDPATSVTGTAVRRLGLRFRSVDPGHLTSSALGGADVAVIPEWGGQSISGDGWKALEEFVRSGKRLVVLSQFPAIVRSLPLSPVQVARPDGTTDSLSVFRADSASRLLNVPNDLRNESWEGWLDRRVPHRLTLHGASADTLATVGSDRIPAVVQWSVGQGRVTYVNLNLQHQFLNVLPAAYRLLSNLIAL